MRDDHDMDENGTITRLEDCLLQEGSLCFRNHTMAILWKLSSDECWLAALVVLVVVSLCLQTAVVTGVDDADYYKLLGISKDASEKEIKRAFRKLAVQYHPDKNPDPEARKKFEKIANGKLHVCVRVNVHVSSVE